MELFKLMQIKIIANSPQQMSNMGPMSVIDESAASISQVFRAILMVDRGWSFPSLLRAHTARHTLDFLNQKDVNFTTPEEWVPKSPDAAPVDFSIWGIV